MRIVLHIPDGAPERLVQQLASTAYWALTSGHLAEDDTPVGVNTGPDFEEHHIARRLVDGVEVWRSEDRP